MRKFSLKRLADFFLWLDIPLMTVVNWIFFVKIYIDVWESNRVHVEIWEWSFHLYPHLLLVMNVFRRKIQLKEPGIGSNCEKLVWMRRVFGWKHASLVFEIIAMFIKNYSLLGPRLSFIIWRRKLNMYIQSVTKKI